MLLTRSVRFTCVLCEERTEIENEKWKCILVLSIVHSFSPWESSLETSPTARIQQLFVANFCKETFDDFLQLFKQNRQNVWNVRGDLCWNLIRFSITKKMWGRKEKNERTKETQQGDQILCRFFFWKMFVFREDQFLRLPKSWCQMPIIWRKSRK